MPQDPQVERTRNKLASHGQILALARAVFSAKVFPTPFDVRLTWPRTGTTPGKEANRAALGRVAARCRRIPVARVCAFADLHVCIRHFRRFSCIFRRFARMFRRFARIFRRCARIFHRFARISPREPRWGAWLSQDARRPRLRLRRPARIYTSFRPTCTNILKINRNVLNLMGTDGTLHRLLNQQASLPDPGFGFRVSIVGFQVSGFGVRAPSPGFQVSGVRRRGVSPREHLSHTLPQHLERRKRAVRGFGSMAHTRQSGPEYGVGFQTKVLETL